MRLRPLNDSVIIEPDTEMIPVDNSQVVLDTLRRGLIHLPEKNMIMKISNRAKVIFYGPKCTYKFRENQEILYDQFADEPFWYEDGERRYRFIKFHYVTAVYE